VNTTVPDVITRYFRTGNDDVDAMVALYTDDAVVIDEDRTHRGTAEIRAWRESTSAAYRYTIEITGSEPDGEHGHVVTARLTGDFPGGVADLRFRFTVAGDLISRLEIAP
jgi:ketosteroid isomerase-like protein